MSKNTHFKAKTLAYCGILIALAFVCSYIKLFSMPEGGSVTLLSMFFIAFSGYIYGPAVGLVTAFCYGLLQFLQKPEIFSVPQVIFDYFLSFGALGVSGFFKKIKHGLIIGYICAVFSRFVFAVLAGLIFWTDFASLSFLQGVWFSVSYNGGYLFAEALITVIVILIPPVRKLLEKMKKLAE